MAPRSTRSRSRRYAGPRRARSARRPRRLGLRAAGPGNAVELADTPVFDRLWRDYPHRTLEASGEAVGLPDGQMGNSEVGHLTIGSGRILFQDLMRVNQAIRDGSLLQNQALVGAFERRERGGTCTCSGSSRMAACTPTSTICSPCSSSRGRRDGGPRRIHAFTDGRDVSPTSAVEDLAVLPAERIATVVGRYYAMDRDRRWERTEKALAAITGGEGYAAIDPRNCHAVQRTTRRVSQTSSSSRSWSRAPATRRTRRAIFFNFRPDRARQLSQQLVERGIDLTTMTRYCAELDVPVAFGEQEVADTLAEVLAAPVRGSSTSRRRRSTRTSPTSSTAGVEDGVGGRDADPRPQPARRPELRPQAGDVGRRGRATVRRGGRRRLPLRGHQLRQSGHGRAHRVDPGRRSRQSRPTTRASAVSSKRRRLRRRLPRHGRPRQRRADVRSGRRQPTHGAHDEPGARSC